MHFITSVVYRAQLYRFISRNGLLLNRRNILNRWMATSTVSSRLADILLLWTVAKFSIETIKKCAETTQAAIT